MGSWEHWAKSCEVVPGKHVDIDKDFDPDREPHGVSRDEADALLAEAEEALFDLQDRFYADSSRALLVVLQATDAAGKDGTIKHVMSGMNPQGVVVYSFKAPSTRERSHDYLWRHQVRAPELGAIAIFNRSHYENVLVTRVHPEYVWPAAARSIDPADLWKQRYREINDWERHLQANGTCVVKIFLDISKDEQGRRFLSRIDEPRKNWKFSAADLQERAYWDAYRQAFEEMLNHTSTEGAPWYVVPSDHQWASRLFTSAILIHALETLDPRYPVVSDDARAELQAAKAQLLGQAPTA